MMKIGYLTNSSHMSGVGHRAKNIQGVMPLVDKDKRLVGFNLNGQRNLVSKEGKSIFWTRKWPGLLGNKSISWVRLGKKLEKYINHKDKNGYDLFHATNQTLSWMAGRLSPMVVTVHDLIELTDPQDKKSALLNNYLIGGVPKAEHIIAASNYTADQIKKVFNVKSEKITVAYNGVGAEFYVIDQFSDSVASIEGRREFKINKEDRIVLFVGSDHVRKNVLGALTVFRDIKKKFSNAVFIKVGAPGIRSERAKLLDSIDAMKLRDSVRLVDSISDEKLNDIYNMSDVLLYPSRNEGFGLPLVQAMACGLPVVASDATAVPEVVGDGGIVVTVDDTEQMAESCIEVLQDDGKRDDLIKRGLKRAAMFSWEESAKKVAGVYDKVAGELNK